MGGVPGVLLRLGVGRLDSEEVFKEAAQSHKRHKRLLMGGNCGLPMLKSCCRLPLPKSPHSHESTP